MTLAIVITDVYGLSNKACHEFLPKHSIAVFAICFTVKGV